MINFYCMCPLSLHFLQKRFLFPTNSSPKIVLVEKNLGPQDFFFFESYKKDLSSFGNKLFLYWPVVYF